MNKNQFAHMHCEKVTLLLQKYTYLHLVVHNSINVIQRDSHGVLVQVLAGMHPGALTIILPDFHHQAVLALLQVVLTCLSNTMFN